MQNSLANADTAVQEISEGEANGTINVDGSDVKIHGLGTAAYSNSDAYETAGAASAVKAELLGNASTDTDASKTIEGLLKKLSTVIQSLDSSAVIASKTGDAVTIRSGITQNDGVVDNDGNADIVLANVAATGNATDISIRDDGNIITAQNLEGALQEIMGNINTIIDQLTWKDI